MKYRLWISLFTGFGLMVFLFSGCNKEEDKFAVMDIDGNGYHSVIIGTQEWLVENLKTTKFNDGSDIPNAADSATWASFAASGYCWNSFDEVKNKEAYGALYNWYAVNTGKLSPLGWHVPTDAEWTVLTDYLGGEAAAGGKLKESGMKHWHSPNMDASNTSGFRALPGGNYSSYWGFEEPGFSCVFWSSTANVDIPGLAWYRLMGSQNAEIGRYSFNKVDGMSVRCLKD